MVYRRCHRFVGPVLAAVAVILAPAAWATPVSNTRLVSCGVESCLVIAGHRENAASSVSINGHPVAVDGRHSWYLRLPLATVRMWSTPHARDIAVTVARPDGSLEVSDDAMLPVGLLGHVTDLAVLTISAR